MRHITFATLFVLAVLICAAIAQAPAGTGLRILSPTSGEKINTDFVTVQYEAAAAATAAGTPTFQLRLDGNDPVHTTDTQYTFTGLAPGTHNVSVQVVDANGTPVGAAQNQVQFTIMPQQQNRGTQPATRGAESQPGRVVPAAMKQDSQDNQHEPLPSSGSPLPVLSVIGMGVLLGGIASALRTRPR